MKKGSLYTTVFSGILGAVCALLLTGAGRMLAPYREANIEAERARNILGVLGVPHDPGLPAQALIELSNATVVEETRGDLTLYKYVAAENGARVEAVAVSFSGSGLWGPIKGFLALEPDLKTIRGVTFHEQEETPGLGGEITAAWFRAQFVGKSILSISGQPGIRIVRGGGADGQNEVDAITGATMTCRKVEAMINATIMKLVAGQSANVE